MEMLGAVAGPCCFQAGGRFFDLFMMSSRWRLPPGVTHMRNEKAPGPGPTHHQGVATVLALGHVAAGHSGLASSRSSPVLLPSGVVSVPWSAAPLRCRGWPWSSSTVIAVTQAASVTAIYPRIRKGRPVCKLVYAQVQNSLRAVQNPLDASLP